LASTSPDGGESFVAGVGEVGVAALSVVEPLRLDRGTGFWDQGSCLPDGDLLSHGIGDLKDCAARRHQQRATSMS